MSWVGCLLKESVPIFLFAENSQILLKIPVIPILVQLNSSLWHMIVRIKIKRDFKTWLIFNHCRRMGLKQSLLESMVFIFLVEFLAWFDDFLPFIYDQFVWWFLWRFCWDFFWKKFWWFFDYFLKIYITIFLNNIFDLIDLLRILWIWFHYLQFFSCSFWCLWLHRQLQGYPSKWLIFWVIRAIC